MTAVDPALRATRTPCPYCGGGCGVRATADNSGGAAISGDPEHPANFGRLCSKGSALGETLGLEDRLLHPMIRCSKGTMERVAWSDALDHVAHRLAHIVKRDGPGAVAFYLSGQLLTEDYYVANKLMKGFIGSANVDPNSRLCLASSVAGPPPPVPPPTLSRPLRGRPHRPLPFPPPPVRPPHLTPPCFAP